jgi:hypothetical protein
VADPRLARSCRRLLSALDPDWPFVLIETRDGNSDWHEATVSVGPQDQPRLRLVRHHRFDLLVTPAEAIEIGRHLHAQGVGGGRLGCVTNSGSDPEQPSGCLTIRVRVQTQCAAGNVSIWQSIYHTTAR